MKPPRFGLPSLTALALVAGGTSVGVGQTVSRPAPASQVVQSSPRPDELVLAAIRSNPLTAPYPIFATSQKGKVILAGRVGTKQVHDTAVRLAIATGVPFRDDLVIDTGMAQLVAQTAAPGVAAGTPGTLGVLASSAYIYPPPLMGRLDDPFFGYVPPLISYPPWWRRAQTGPMVQPRRTPDGGSAAIVPSSNGPAPNGASKEGWQPLGADPALGQVEVSVDVTGQVFLRGSVVSEQAARAIEEAARSVPGVTGVSSELTVVPRRADAEVPPPPPVPMLDPAAPEGRVSAPAGRAPAPPSAASAVVPAHPKTAPSAPFALDSQPLTRQVVSGLERRPQASELPVKVRSSNGVVTLSGKVPSAYEAMLVYRAAQQTPGVREIVDRLEFTVPDEDHPNPLVRKGRPEDVEPYLASQIRLHVGDLAHIDRLQSRGDIIELKGTLQHAEDHERLLAILRSIPVLHGFRLEPEFKAE